MLQDKISQDYVKAMKDRDKVRSQALNFLRAQLKNAQLDKRAESLDDLDVISVIKKQVKQRQDSITQFRDGGREDLVEKEESELNILKGYLPEELSEEQLRVIIQQAIAETGALTPKDMGKVIKLVQEKAQGRADNKTVSTLVKELLN